MHVDRLAAWGEATEPRYRAVAPQTARFVVTGNPRFDPLAERSVRTARLDPGSTRSTTRGVFTIVICTGFVTEFSVGASEYENLFMIDSVLA